MGRPLNYAIKNCANKFLVDEGISENWGENWGGVIENRSLVPYKRSGIGFGPLIENWGEDWGGVSRELGRPLNYAIKNCANRYFVPYKRSGIGFGP